MLKIFDKINCLGAESQDIPLGPVAELASERNFQLSSEKNEEEGNILS